MINNSKTRLIATIFIAFVIFLSLNATNLRSVHAQNQLSIALNVSNNEQITEITGTVTDLNQNPISLAKVSIQVDDPSGKTLHVGFTNTDQSGNFIDRFSTPEELNGECTIYISASKSGYENGTAQGTFIAIPEFSTIFIAIIVPILLALLMLRRKASK